MNKYVVRILLPALLIAIVACGATPDEQRELRVITSGGFAAAFNTLAPQFEEETGVRLLTEYGASLGGGPESIPVRLERGELFDVIILSRSSLNKLTDLGEVRPDSRTDLVRSLIGMAVRAGADLPDISTAEAFVQTVLNAESFGYSASSSGKYLSTVLFPKLGLWESLQPKATRVVGERVGSVVARGEVEIGFQQISELLPIEGITFVGPIPAEYQKVTTFSAAVTTRAENVTDAQRLIVYLSSVDVAATIEKTGLRSVALEK